jgi:hypothetical protein
MPCLVRSTFETTPDFQARKLILEPRDCPPLPAGEAPEK